MEAHLQEESKLWSFVVLRQKHIKNARRRSKERNLTWRNSRGWQLWDTFWVLKGVHFIYTICFFEAREVRSPTLQTVHKLELERRSYGHLKTTVQSWAKWAAKISQGVSQLRNHPLAHECHFTAPPPHFAATKWAAKWPVKMFLGCEPPCEITSKLRFKLQIISKLWNHLQVAKSQIQLTKSKFKLAKWIIQHVKSTCVNSDICNRLN